MSRTFRATMLAGVSLCALLSAAPASAQQSANERIYRQEALAHARAVTTAWRRLESYILEGSAGTPRSPGHKRLGLERRGPAGRQRLVGRLDVARRAGALLRRHAAGLSRAGAPQGRRPRSPRGPGRAPRLRRRRSARRGPVLHWLEPGRAAGAAGRPSVPLPACLSDTAFGGPLPSGRAALAGTVRDPYAHTNERVSRERQLEDCAAGEHGQGRTRVREAAQTHDERGNPVGDPVFGPWQVLIDECRADYTGWETYTLVCHWDAGPPHNRRMEGREIWRRLKSVTAEGETLGPPEFVSTSCWTGKVPDTPKAVVTETAQTEAMTDGCPSGYIGSQEYRRTATRRATQFPWDAEPIVQINYGPWILQTDNCEAVIPPDWGGDPDAGGDGGDVGGDGGPGDDSCDTVSNPDDPGSDVCTIDSSIGFDTSSFGDGEEQDAGDGGDCFLTTAIVERRGIEADGGPTLTALRRFRDGYMMKTPKRRALVAEYYELAPRIAAAIPQGHSDWDWIGGRIDAAIAAIYAGDEDGAFGIYAAMVRRLAACWTEPASRMAAGANTTKGARR